MYKLVLPLPMGVTMVSKESFETWEHAYFRAKTRFSDYPAMEVWEESQVDKLSTRKVFFPEKEHNNG